MKLGCSSWSYHRQFMNGELDFMKWISICADELKLDCVELLDFHLDQSKTGFKEIKNHIVSSGLDISSVSVSNSFGYADGKKQQEEVEKVKRWTDITLQFGASILRVFAGWPGAAPWDTGSADIRNKKKYWPGMTACMSECVAYAEETGVVLAVENHNHGGFINTMEDVERITGEIDSPWFRLNLDTNGYVKDAYAAIEKTLPLAVQVHAKIACLADDGGDRQIDYGRIFDILKRSGYNGFFSIELGEADGYGSDLDEYTAVSRVAGFMRKMMCGM